MQFLGNSQDLKVPNLYTHTSSTICPASLKSRGNMTTKSKSWAQPPRLVPAHTFIKAVRLVAVRILGLTAVARICELLDIKPKEGISEIYNEKTKSHVASRYELTTS